MARLNSRTTMSPSSSDSHLETSNETSSTPSSKLRRLRSRLSRSQSKSKSKDLVGDADDDDRVVSSTPPRCSIEKVSSLDVDIPFQQLTLSSGISSPTLQSPPYCNSSSPSLYNMTVSRRDSGEPRIKESPSHLNSPATGFGATTEVNGDDGQTFHRMTGDTLTSEDAKAALMLRLQNLVVTRGARVPRGKANMTTPILVDFAATAFSHELSCPMMFAGGNCDIKSWLASLLDRRHEARWRDAVWTLREHAQRENIILLYDNNIISKFCAAVVRYILNRLSSVNEGTVNANSWRQAHASSNALNMFKIAKFLLAWLTWYETGSHECLSILESCLALVRSAPGATSDASGIVIVSRLEAMYNDIAAPPVTRRVSVGEICI